MSENYGTPYEQDIAELIPLAAMTADKVVGYRPRSGDAGCERWNEIYHHTMDRLAASNGIRRMSWQG